VMTLSNTYRGISELLNTDLGNSWKIIHPNDTEGVLSYIEYDMTIASGPYNGTATFKILLNSLDNTLGRTITSNVASLNGGNYLVANVAAEAGLNSRMARTRYEFPVFARDVATFAVTRVSTWTYQIQIGMQSVEHGSPASEGLTLCATNTFLAPGAR